MALGRGQVGGGVSGGIWGHGGCPHMHAHASACTHMHTHTCIELQMAASMEAFMFSMFSMFNMHVCVCVHACVWVRAWMGHPPHTHTYPYPHPPICHPPRGWTPPESLKIRLHFNLSRYFNSVWRFEICEEFPTHGWVCGLVCGWVVGWVDGWGQVKSLKIPKMLTESR